MLNTTLYRLSIKKDRSNSPLIALMHRKVPTSLKITKMHNSHCFSNVLYAQTNRMKASFTSSEFNIHLSPIVKVVSLGYDSVNRENIENAPITDIEELNVTNCRFINNSHIEGNGGCIHWLSNTGTGNIKIDRSVFRNNSARYGGCIYVNDFGCSINITDTELGNSNAVKDGSHLYILCHTLDSAKNVYSFGTGGASIFLDVLEDCLFEDDNFYKNDGEIVLKKEGEPPNQAGGNSGDNRQGEGDKNKNNGDSGNTASDDQSGNPEDNGQGESTEDPGQGGNTGNEGEKGDEPFMFIDCCFVKSDENETSEYFVRAQTGKFNLASCCINFGENTSEGLQELRTNETGEGGDCGRCHYIPLPTSTFDANPVESYAIVVYVAVALIIIGGIVSCFCDHHKSTHPPHPKEDNTEEGDEVELLDNPEGEEGEVDASPKEENKTTAVN